jgi:hypothetical protein
MTYNKPDTEFDHFIMGIIWQSIIYNIFITYKPIHIVINNN